MAKIVASWDKERGVLFEPFQKALNGLVEVSQDDVLNVVENNGSIFLIISSNWISQDVAREEMRRDFRLWFRARDPSMPRV